MKEPQSGVDGHVLCAELSGGCGWWKLSRKEWSNWHAYEEKETKKGIACYYVTGSLCLLGTWIVFIL